MKFIDPIGIGATSVHCESKWSGPIMSILGIPHQILPDVCPSSHLYGYIETGPLCVPDGAVRVPVTGIIGDAQAATLTEDCLGPGQAKLTLGTGTFLNLSTGSKPRALMNGFYPVVGWASTDRFNDTASVCERTTFTHQGKSKTTALTTCASIHSLGSDSESIRTSDVTYLLEGSHENTGTLIEWLRTEGGRFSPYQLSFSNHFVLHLFISAPPFPLFVHVCMCVCVCCVLCDTFVGLMSVSF
ncbi:unnamed protein product [Echinostoma caproni]|uniref:AMP-binding domain-containing protein n=1 Tax=Echinostoma caproni TaxID=27848 RepID=A0A183AXF1_9TREM|nr:unnamed protein product [Echinostoma caproni]